MLKFLFGPKSDPVTAFIFRVKETLAKRGWVKGRSRDDMGRVCLSAAIEVTNGEVTPEVKTEATKRIQKVIKQRGMPGEIVHFNDDKATQKEDVDEVLDRAATV